MKAFVEIVDEKEKDVHILLALDKVHVIGERQLKKGCFVLDTEVHYVNIVSNYSEVVNALVNNGVTVITLPVFEEKK